MIRSVTGTGGTYQAFSAEPGRDLPEFDTPPADPLDLLKNWVERALSIPVREPLALALATARPTGVPTTRTVLVKEIDHGLIFTTHTHTAKGADIAVNPQAAGTFYWRETLQQVHVAGRVGRLTARASDRLWADRPRPAQAAVIVSRPGADLVDEASLRRNAAALAASSSTLQRPPEWHGFRLTIERAEFWHGRPDRLHRRLAYSRQGQRWTFRRLQP